MSDDSFRVKNAVGKPSAEQTLRVALLQIEEALRGLRFGQVTINVQDGVVVQIERLERIRVPRPAE